jgi:hypothetical protein
MFSSKVVPSSHRLSSKFTFKSRNISLLLAVIFSPISYAFYHKYSALYDFSFMTNTAQRLLNGERPYLDFDLVLPLGSFLPIVLVSTILKCSVFTSMQFLLLAGTVVSLYFLIRIISIVSYKDSPWLVFLMSATSCALFVNNLYPHYSYETFGSLLTIILVYQVLTLTNRVTKSQTVYLVLTFIALWSTKYNIALGASALYWIAIYVKHSGSFIFFIEAKKRIVLIPVIGFLISMIAHLCVGKNEFIYQTLTYPSEYKSIFSFTQLAYYKSLMIILTALLVSISFIWKRYSLLFLSLALSLNFFWGTTKLFIRFGWVHIEHRYDQLFSDSDFVFLPVLMLFSLAVYVRTYRSKVLLENQRIILLGFPPLFACFFTSMSWWGSYYGVLSLAPVLIIVLSKISRVAFTRSFRLLLLSYLSLCLFASLVSVSNRDLLNYVHATPAHTLVKSKLITGIWTDKTYEKDLEQIIGLLTETSINPIILEYPMEDPIFTIVKGAKPWVRCVQLGLTCSSKNDFNLTLDPEYDYFYLVKKQPQILMFNKIENNPALYLSRFRLVLKASNTTFDLYTVMMDRALDF